MGASIAVLVATSGRSTLAAALASVAPQLRPGDELLVDVNDDAPFGNQARNRLMDRASCNLLMFVDDDDTMAPGALELARRCDDGRLHIFRMRYWHGTVLWQARALVCGNISTQMLVVPNVFLLPRWGRRYESDFDFACDCARDLGEPVWHEEVVAEIRPHLAHG